MMKTTLLLLANSAKHHQHCIAGIDLNTRKWRRIVADETGKEVDFNNYNFYDEENNIFIKNIYVFSLPFLMEINIEREVPLNTQPENCIIGSNIILKRSTNRNLLINFLQYPKSLWGESNKIYKDFQARSSLFLIRVDEIRLYWKDRSMYNKTPQRRAKFWYNEIEYDLPVTDLRFENMQEQILYDKFLVISLGEPYEGYCYKIIASII